MKSNRLSILFTVIFIIAVVLFIITVSIGLPIYLRFFYYLHINALDLPQKTGYDYATIKHAYDQMLNYLTLPNTEFSTGIFAFSKDGASHFADCKVLFNLNAITLIVSTTSLVENPITSPSLAFGIDTQPLATKHEIAIKPINIIAFITFIFIIN